MSTASRVLIFWLGVSTAFAFMWALAGLRRHLQQIDDDPIVFEDPDDRAVRERAINETLAIIDQWNTHDFPWLRHPANGLTEQQIRRICDEIHADMERVERGEEIL